jgi:hypothetical protein
MTSINANSKTGVTWHLTAANLMVDSSYSQPLRRNCT